MTLYAKLTIGLIIAAGVVVAATVLLVRSNGTPQRRGVDDGLVASNEPLASGEIADVVHRLPDPVTRQNIDDDWDKLSRAQRVERASVDFEQALAHLEVDPTNPEQGERARRALTLLRPELFIDRSGTKTYIELERRFEDLAE